MNLNQKPLGMKNYGSIPHLPNSRMGPGDHCCHEGQAVICTARVRDRRDRIWVTEKLDGSNVGVAHLDDGQIVALGRAGYLARTSKFEQHQMFADWVTRNEGRLRALLKPGERVAGEWLAQAHGTRILLHHEPFVIFDMFDSRGRQPWEYARNIIARSGFITPFVLNDGLSPMSIEDAIAACTPSHHGQEEAEGAVWRVERDGKFDFMAKYVKPSKIDGVLLPEISGKNAVWNWRPA